MILKNFFIFLFFIVVTSLAAQTTIVLNENPVSDREDGLYLTSSNRYKLFPIKDSKKQEPIFRYNNGLGVEYFKSLIVSKDKISIQLDLESIDEYFKSKKRTIAFIFNDTIYQLRKVNKLFIDKAIFTVENLSQQDTKRIINYYKSLPSNKTQYEFKNSLKEHDFKKADSLLKHGAYIMRGSNIYYDAYEERDTLLINYFKKINYAQKAKTLQNAIKTHDKEYIIESHKLAKDKPWNQDMLNNNYIRAAQYGSKEIVKLFLNYGADKNFNREQLRFDTDESGYINALDYAAIYGEIEVVDYLISKGVRGIDQTAFMSACFSNNQFMIDHLLKRGYNINIQDSKGYSTLHLLLNHAKIDRTILLINRGIDVNLVDLNGNTALHKLASLTYAPLLDSYRLHGVKSSDLEKIANSLIDNGVNVNLKNKNGFTALEVAKGREGKIDRYHMNTNDELIALLEKLKK